MGPGLPGQRSVAGRRGPGLRRGAVGPAAGHAARRRRRPGHGRDVRADGRRARSRPAGSSAPTRSPRSPTAGPSSRAWRPPSSSSPRTSSPTPRPTPTPTSCCPARCGPRPRASWSTPSATSPWPSQAVDPPGEALPDWRIIAAVACAMGYAEAFAYAQRRGGLRGDQAGLEPGDRLRPARRELRAAARDPGAVARRHRGRARTATRSATSTTASARPLAPTAPPGCLPDRERPGGLLRPPAPARRPSCPTTTTRSCSTPAGSSTSGTP